MLLIFEEGAVEGELVALKFHFLFDHVGFLPMGVVVNDYGSHHQKIGIDKNLIKRHHALKKRHSVQAAQ
jgi:hypothetical protein